MSRFVEWLLTEAAAISQAAAADVIMRVGRERPVTVTYKKLDGSKRKVVARYGVRPERPGKGMTYDPADANSILVYDDEAQNYKTLKLSGIISVQYDGKTVKVKRR